MILSRPLWFLVLVLAFLDNCVTLIITDFSGTILSNLFVHLGHSNGKNELDENTLRHMVLNTLRSYEKKYGSDYGEMVIAMDSRAGYWRKQVFPYYKASRKTSLEASPLDWENIFVSLNKIREELKTYFSWRIIDVEGAEADDVIGVLTRRFGTDLVMGFGQKILILSSDKDFIQLHHYGNVRQFSPLKKKYISHPSPVAYLREHIIRGDVGDGVPNFMSPDDCLVVKSRQTPVSTKKLLEWVKHPQPPETLNNDRLLRGWKRNQQLIDLTFTPKHIEEAINKQYDAQEGKKSGDLFSYFMEHRMKEMMSEIHDFA